MIVASALLGACAAVGTTSLGDGNTLEDGMSAAKSPGAPAAARTEASQAITLRFAGEFAGQPFSCAQRYPNIGTTQATVGLSDYKLFVFNVHLTSATGERIPVMLNEDGMWQQETVGLLDFEDGSGSCTNGTA